MNSLGGSPENRTVMSVNTAGVHALIRYQRGLDFTSASLKMLKWRFWLCSRGFCCSSTHQSSVLNSQLHQISQMVCSIANQHGFYLLSQSSCPWPSTPADLSAARAQQTKSDLSCTNMHAYTAVDVVIRKCTKRKGGVNIEHKKGVRGLYF